MHLHYGYNFMHNKVLATQIVVKLLLLNCWCCVHALKFSDFNLHCLARNKINDSKFSHALTSWSLFFGVEV